MIEINLGPIEGDGAGRYFPVLEQAQVLTFDPSGYWAGSDVTKDRLILASGYIGMFALAAIVSLDESKPLHEKMMDEYENFSGANFRFNQAGDVHSVSDTGVLQYGDPEAEDADDPQFPLWKLFIGNEVCYFYPYAMLAFVTDGKLVFYTRMD